MYSLLTFTFSFTNILTYLNNPSIIIAIICGSLGLGTAILSKKVVVTIRKDKDIEQDDAILLFMRMLGLLLICTAIFFIIFSKQ